MKIISKFKDYYDGLSSHDASTGVYERTTKEIPVDWIGYANSCIGDEYYELSTGLVGFCGKVYPYVKYKYRLKNNVKGSGFAYTLQEYEAVLKIIKKITPSRYHWMGGCNIFDPYSKKSKTSKCWFEKDFQTLIDGLPNWKTSTSGRTPEYVKLEDVYYDHKVPYFALERSTREEWTAHGWQQQFKLTLNPRLLDYGFQGILDPFTAHQEIEMFMNNQIVRPDDPYIEPVSDKIKAEAHGFNKFSFRKDKTKTKRSKK